jgi:hypothetical protein
MAIDLELFIETVVCSIGCVHGEVA